MNDISKTNHIEDGTKIPMQDEQIKNEQTQHLTQTPDGPKTNKHKHRSNKSAGVILIDPWSSNIHEHTSYRVLVVQQRNSGVWGLPKGHLEENEDLETAAHRELLEETGIVFQDLNEQADYIPLDLHDKQNETSTIHTNHIQIKKIHFFVYVLLRRGSSLVHGEYDQNEISDISWINVHNWYIDSTSSYLLRQQPQRFNRTLSDTSVNIVMDMCLKAKSLLQKKYGYTPPDKSVYTQCLNLF